MKILLTLGPGSLHLQSRGISGSSMLPSLCPLTWSLKTEARSLPARAYSMRVVSAQKATWVASSWF